MLQEQRRKDILQRVSQYGTIRISEICQLFGVSEMTARRDLRELDRDGLLRRIHGGAINNLGRSYEPPYKLRINKGVNEKVAIGRKAAELVNDGDSVALDIGSTTLEVARALREKRNLTIVTSSLPIANEITAKFGIGSDVRLIITGGIVRPREFSLIGHIAEQTYREFNVDKAFIGVGGLSLDAGLTEFNMEDALVKRPLLKNSHYKIVVAEGVKLGRTAFTHIAPLSSIDTVVTDKIAPEEIVRGLTELGIRVVIADE